MAIKSYTQSIEVNGTNKHSVTAIFTYDVFGAATGDTVTHVITWSLGQHSHTETIKYGANGVAATASYAIPMEWLNEIPNSITGTGTVTVESHSPVGGIQTATKNFTVKVPATCKPSITSITAGIHNDNSVLQQFGIAVYGFSKLSMTPSAINLSYSSPIKSYAVTCGGVTYRGSGTGLNASNKFITDLLRYSGDISLTYTVTDMRDRTSEPVTSNAVYVHPYSRPLITIADAYRCDKNGNKSSDGEYMRVTAKASVSNLASDSGTVTNVLTLFASWDSSANEHGQQLMENDVPIMVGIDKTKTYSLTITARDLLMETHAYRKVVSENVAIHVKDGGKAVGIGKYANSDNRFEVAFPSYFDNGVTVEGNVFIKGADIHGALQTFGKATDMIATYTTPGGETYYGDFNDYTYFGVYGVAVGTNVSQIYNAPCDKAGTLRVYSADGVFTTVNDSHHLIQEYVVYDASAVYRRYGHYNGINWSFNQWYCYKPTT